MNFTIDQWNHGNKNAIDLHSTQKEGKFVVAQRFFKTLKNKIYKYRISISKYDYIDKLDDIVNTTIHITETLKRSLLM